MAAFAPYRWAADATGVWAHQFLSAVPDVSVADVADEIAALAGRTRVPLTAYARTGGSDFSSSLLLVRDPSVTHGTPAPADCERAAAQLAAGGNWHSQGQMIRSAVLVAIGLREGYDPSARVHTFAEFEQRVLRDLRVWSGMSAELISARPQPGGAVQIYHEPGALTFADWEHLPTLATIADDFAQDRFVTHDWLAHRTTAYSRTTGKDA